MKQTRGWIRAYFTEGSRLYREYIFYFLAFNAVERIKRTVFIFFHHAAFFLSVLYWFDDWQKEAIFCVVYALWGMLECDGGLNSLWRWCSESLVSPVHTLTFVYISGCDHLCLFSFRFRFLLQALLSALCLNLKFRQDVQLRSSMKMK